MNSIKIQYKAETGRIRTVRAFRCREALVNPSIIDGNGVSLLPPQIFVFWDGPHGSHGAIPKADILTISRREVDVT